MTSSQFWSASTDLPRTDRDQAEAALRRAHADGRLGNAEFERRLGQVFVADSHQELDLALNGPLPTGSGPGRSVELARLGQASPQTETVVSGIAHLLPFVTWIIGPAVVYAVSPQGSIRRREAAKAFNFQLISVVIGILVGILGGLLPGEGNPLQPIWQIIWVGLTLFGAVMAFQGKDWTNPARALVKRDFLSERLR